MVEVYGALMCSPLVKNVAPERGEFAWIDGIDKHANNIVDVFRINVDNGVCVVGKGWVWACCIVEPFAVDTCCVKMRVGYKILKKVILFRDLRCLAIHCVFFKKIKKGE